MGNSLSRLLELWQNTSRTNRIMVIALIAAMALVGVGFMLYAGTPDYQTLVNNPSPSDSSKILALIKEKKVPYRISLDGGTIEVPSEQKAELRMALAGAGLMNSGTPGYELLDKAPFGETQAMEHSRLQRAIEGEMEKSIQSLEPVASANVKFAEGDSSDFINPAKRDPSASLLVHLKAGAELSKANVKAIVSLVRASYPGLTDKNISLVDGEGNLLWDGAQQASDTVGADDRMTQERAYKEALAREIQSQIKAAVGPNKSCVTVRAVLNLDKQSETKRTILPGVKTSKSVEEETLKGGGSISGGRTPVGVASNTSGASTPPTYTGSNVDTGSGNYSHTTTTETMAAGQSETQTVTAPGDVKFLAVSVMLDDSIPIATRTAIQQTVQTLIGQDPLNPTARQVTVQAVPFDKTAVIEEKKIAEAARTQEQMNRYIGYGAPILLIIIMFILLARGLKRMTPTISRQPLLAGAGQTGALTGGSSYGSLDLTVGENGPQGMTVGQALDQGEPKVIGITSGQPQTHSFEVISEAFDSNLESIVHLSKTKPELVARLIKSMLAEDK